MTIMVMIMMMMIIIIVIMIDVVMENIHNKSATTLAGLQN